MKLCYLSLAYVWYMYIDMYSHIDVHLGLFSSLRRHLKTNDERKRRLLIFFNGINCLSMTKWQRKTINKAKIDEQEREREKRTNRRQKDWTELIQYLNMREEFYYYYSIEQKNKDSVSFFFFDSFEETSVRFRLEIGLRDLIFFHWSNDWILHQYNSWKKINGNSSKEQREQTDWYGKLGLAKSICSM